MGNPLKKLKDKLEKFSEEHSGGVAEKIGSFFNPEPQKEKVLRHEDFNAAGDVYYADISVAYKIAQRFLLLLLVLFLVFSIILNYREITYDNFYYLFKDFSNAVDAGSSNYETLSYDSDERQIFSLYKGGLVTVSPSAVSIYTATGRRTIKENISYSSPHVVCSNKYVFVYDSAGNSFSIYNSFSRVFKDSVEYPITDICWGNDGRFAIVTKTYDSKSIIYLYDKDFEPKGEYEYDFYVFDVALNSEDDLMSALYYDTGNGIGKTMMLTYNLNDQDEKNIKTLSFNGEFPLGVQFLKDGKIGLVTDYAARIIDKDMKVIEDEEYFDEKVIDFNMSDGGIAVATLKNAKNKIIAFDKSGKLVYNSSIDYNVSDIGFEGDFLFANTGNGVLRISVEDTKNDSNEFLPSDNGELLIYDSNTALVCGSAKAEYLVFGKN